MTLIEARSLCVSRFGECVTRLGDTKNSTKDTCPLYMPRTGKCTLCGSPEKYHWNHLNRKIDVPYRVVAYSARRPCREVTEFRGKSISIPTARGKYSRNKDTDTEE